MRGFCHHVHIISKIKTMASVQCWSIRLSTKHVGFSFLLFFFFSLHYSSIFSSGCSCTRKRVQYKNRTPLEVYGATRNFTAFFYWDFLTFCYCRALLYFPSPPPEQLFHRRSRRYPADKRTSFPFRYVGFKFYSNRETVDCSNVICSTTTISRKFVVN